MCGITGAAWSAGGPSLSLADLHGMTQALAHRGPDAAGYYHSQHAPRALSHFSPVAAASHQPASLGADHAEVGNDPVNPSRPGAALGHRRLSIIDLSGGSQPLCNEDGTIWIAFNGEIYNYRELAPDLVRRGHRLATASDTETIVHLYEEHGPACVDRLRGMFAFAIWDERRGALFLARDRLGKKPLVLRREAQRLLFASELKSLLQLASLPRQVDPQALDEYLTYQYVGHPRCILQGFEKLPPGHWAMYQDGMLRVERYWRPNFAHSAPSESSVSSRSELKDQLRSELSEAVQLRLRSDVPLGAFLSGGVDSTIIAGLMQRHAGRPVQTFSIGFSVPRFDERTYARLAAEHLGTEHHEFVVDPSALSILPKLIWHYDEPFADSSAIPTMYLSEMTRRHVTVALSGDGGDELFAGYERYRAVQLAARFDHLPAWLRATIGSPLWQRLPASVEQRSKRRRLKRLLAVLGEPPEQRYLKWISIFDAERRQALYTPEFARRLGGADSAEFLYAAYRETPPRDFVTRTTAVDIATYLPCDILNKVDIASMAYGLEVRCPFLDQNVVDWAAQLPMRFKLHRGRGKRLLVEAFGDLLPAAIRSRSKMGFGVPLDHWFRGELVPLLHDVLLAQRARERGIFRPESVAQLIQEHTSRKWDHSYRLWALLVLELWMIRFIDNPTSV